MAETAVCGWDIGGAHLKLVCLDDAARVIGAREIVCPLWRGVEHLQSAMLSAWPQDRGGNTRHAVTMTGELCDNFESRAHGVREILAVVGETLGEAQTQVYAGSHGFRRLAEVPTLGPEWVASANWRALADAVALTHDDVVLIDVGSTTTDIIPIVSGAVASRGTDDATRLSHDELVYTGIVRTPLMALCDQAPFAGQWQRVAAEHFATTADVYRILGELPEHADLHETADGAAKTVVASARRVCRMLGRDPIDNDEAVRKVSRYFAYRQFDVLQRAFMGVLSGVERRCESIVAAGVGRFLVERLARFNGANCVDISSLFNVAEEQRFAVSTCAPAAAVAKLLWHGR